MQIFVLFVMAMLVVYTSSLKQLQNNLRTKSYRSIYSMSTKKENSPEVIMNRYSRIITEPPSQGASQAMLYATGLTPESIQLPQVIFILNIVVNVFNTIYDITNTIYIIIIYS